MKSGITQDEVLQILGKPKREEAFGGRSPHSTWYYCDDSSNAKVEIDKSSGQLTRWEEPEFPHPTQDAQEAWWNLRLGLTKAKVVEELGVPGKDQGDMMGYVWENAEGWVEFRDGQVVGMGLEDTKLYGRVNLRKTSRSSEG